MNVMLLGSVGIVRYSTEMARNLRNNKYGIDVDSRIYRSLPFLGAVPGQAIGTLFTDFSKYKIVHNLTAYTFLKPPRRKFILVTTAHELQAFTKPELNDLQLLTLQDKLWFNYILKSSKDEILGSDYVMTNSIQTRNEVHKLGMPTKRIFLTNLGVDDRFLRKILKKRTGKFIIGCVSTIGPRKNTLFAINAFKKITSKNVELHLWGKSIYRKNEVPVAIGDDKRIKLMKYAPESKFVDIYDSFNVFVLPSLYEGFGLPIIEAKARGLPVILYKKAHISPEVKRYCFEAEDEQHMADIIQNLKDNGYNEKLRKKATNDARRFTWARTAEETIKAYRKIIG